MVPAVISRLHPGPQASTGATVCTKHLHLNAKYAAFIYLKLIPDGLMDSLKALPVSGLVCTSRLFVWTGQTGGPNDRQMNHVISGENALRPELQLNEMDLHQPITACHSEWKTHEH